MDLKRKSRMLAKARGKYGKPVYPGKTYDNERVNNEDQLETEKESIEKKLCVPMQTVLETWDKIKEILKEEVSPVSYETWIEPCQPIEITSSKFVLMAENAFFKEMLEKRYLAYLCKAVKLVTAEKVTTVELVSEAEYKLRKEAGWER